MVTRARSRRRKAPWNGSATRRKCSITETSRRCAGRSSAAPTVRARSRLRDCAQRDAATDVAKSFAADAWVLVAACALVDGDVRRSEQALALARERDDDNPRIALVEAWALERSAGTDPARREAVAAQLTAVVEAFDAWTPSIDDPDWGHAEALTALAADALERGQVRTARDLIERALLLAPEYRAAVELRAALQNARTGNRAL